MGEVADVVGGGTPKSSEESYFGGDIPWITPADLSGYSEKFISRGKRSLTPEGLSNSGAKMMPTGTVLFSSRAPIGYVAIAANPICTNQGFKSFVLKPEISPDFVYYYLQHAKPLALALASGTTFLEISGKRAAEIPVPVPPLDQQKSIVEEVEKQFSRLDAGIAALKRAQANLKRYRASVLKAACEGYLVQTDADKAKNEGGTYISGQEYLENLLLMRRQNADSTGKYKEPESPSDVALNVPEGWTIGSLDQLFAHITDGDHQAPPQTKEGVPFLVIGNVRDGVISFLNSRYVTSQYAKTVDPKRKPRRGDILYTLVGSFGIAVPVDTDQEFCIQRHIGVLRPHPATPRSYLLVALRSELVFDQAARISTGTAQMTVPLAGLRRISIPIPPPAEQDRIVAEVERLLSVADAVEANIDQQLASATRLRQSILAKSFGAESPDEGNY